MSMRLSIPNLSAKKPKWGLLVKLLSAREEDVPSVYKGRPGMIQEMFLFLQLTLTLEKATLRSVKRVLLASFPCSQFDTEAHNTTLYFGLEFGIHYRLKSCDKS